jgi:hypothetical protein
MNEGGGRARFFLAASAVTLVVSGLAVAKSAFASETQSYVYDALGRLVSVQSSGTINAGQAHSLCYDPAGNRTIYKTSSAGELADCSGSSSSGNQPPVTAPDSLTVRSCGAIGHVNVTANDTDPEGNYPLTLVSVTSGARGHASVYSSSTIEYIAGPRSGNDVVTYTVKDSLGASATGRVNVTISGGICQ